MSRLLLLFFSLTLASCSTLQEVTDDDDSSIGYTKAKNEKGQSVYKRTRIIKTAVFPMPTNTTVPSTSIKNSPTKITHKKLDPAKRDLLPQTLLQNKPSTNNKPQDKSFHGLFELSSGSDITHIGVGFNYEFGSNLDGKVDFALFSGLEDLYLGIDLGARAKLIINDLQAFVGVGSYFGDNKHCNEKTDDLGNTIETCEKKFLFAKFTEIGVRYKRVAIFAREYHVNDADISLPIKNIWGFNFYF